MDVADYPQESVLKEDFEASVLVLAIRQPRKMSVVYVFVVQVGLEATAFYELNFPVYEAVRST